MTEVIEIVLTFTLWMDGSFIPMKSERVWKGPNAAMMCGFEAPSEILSVVAKLRAQGHHVQVSQYNCRPSGQDI